MNVANPLHMSDPSVEAPTTKREELATRILREHGAHFVDFLGQYIIESISR